MRRDIRCPHCTKTFDPVDVACEATATFAGGTVHCVLLDSLHAEMHEGVVAEPCAHCGGGDEHSTGCADADALASRDVRVVWEDGGQPSIADDRFAGVAS